MHGVKSSNHGVKIIVHAIALIYPPHFSLYLFSVFINFKFKTFTFYIILIIYSLKKS